MRAPAAVLVALIVATVATGCGDDDDGADEGAGASGGSAGSSAGGDRADGGGAGGAVAGGDGRAGSAGTAATGGSGAAGGAGSSGSGSSGSGSSGSGSSGSGSSGSGAGAGLPAIGGCTLFSADDAWNQDVSAAEVDADWTARLHALVGDIDIHPDYGNSGDEHYGIPINVVPQTQPKLDVSIDWYPEESDPGPYPFPAPGEAKIEGGVPEACDGDCHLLVVQQGSCMLYEGYACSFDAGWHCGGEATWDLARNGYGQRPEGDTSADAAGLAITPGLVRFDEVEAGELRHAIRFTTRCTRASHIAPASHHAVPGSCDGDDPNAPPMGLRVRLRADFELSGLSEPARVVARAMQRYGMILADNGSNFYFQGEDHPGWTEQAVEPLKTIPASAFEVVRAR